MNSLNCGCLNNGFKCVFFFVSNLSQDNGKGHCEQRPASSEWWALSTESIIKQLKINRFSSLTKNGVPKFVQGKIETKIFNLGFGIAVCLMYNRWNLTHSMVHCKWLFTCTWEIRRAKNNTFLMWYGYKSLLCRSILIYLESQQNDESKIEYMNHKKKIWNTPEIYTLG